jgi:hypothetical protein
LPFLQIPLQQGCSIFQGLSNGLSHALVYQKYWQEKTEKTPERLLGEKNHFSWGNSSEKLRFKLPPPLGDEISSIIFAAAVYFSLSRFLCLLYFLLLCLANSLFVSGECDG